MRRALVVAVLATPAAASADTFGGFSGVDRPYLVNQDKVCAPLKVSGGSAAGAPACEKAAADVVARLSMKAPIPQTGPKAAFAATAAGRTLTIVRKQSGATVVTWEAIDAIARVVDVYASQYEDRIAVAYITRRAGKEITDVVGFDLGQGASTVRPAPGDPKPSQDPPEATPAPADPKVTAAVTAARKAPKARAIGAWQAVLALDAGHPEALYRIATAQLAAKQRADALATIERLGGSTHAEAIEWRIEARFDGAFAALRADPKFRAAVGLDRKGSSAYERLMGFGGQWEQTGTACDKPEVRLTASRDRSFKLRVKTSCQGSVYDTPFKGTWRLDGDRVVLGLPNQGKVTKEDEAGCVFEASGDEDALRCTLGRDLEFSVLPARR